MIIIIHDSVKDVPEAATRVFSNAAGSYSANVGIAIENGASVDEEQLQELCSDVVT